MSWLEHYSLIFGGGIGGRGDTHLHCIALFCLWWLSLLCFFNAYLIREAGDISFGVCKALFSYQGREFFLAYFLTIYVLSSCFFTFLDTSSCSYFFAGGLDGI